MMPAIDQQNLAKEKNNDKPSVEDMLNIKRSDTPQKVTPHEVGNTTSNDEKQLPQILAILLFLHNKKHHYQTQLK